MTDSGPPKKLTLQGFASVRPPTDPPSSDSVDAVQEIFAAADEVLPPMATAEEPPQPFVAANRGIHFRQTLPFGSTLEPVPDAPAQAPAPAASGEALPPAVVQPAGRQGERLSGWAPSVSVGPAREQSFDPHGTLAGIAPNGTPVTAETTGVEVKQRSSHPPAAIVSPVIRVSAPAPVEVVNTQGETVTSDESTSVAAQSPVDPGDEPDMSVARSVVSAVSTVALVPSGHRAVALSSQEPRPGVMRALLAAVDVLQTGRAADEGLQAPEAPAPMARPITVTMAKPPPLARRRELTAVDLPNSGRAESFRLLRHRLRAVGDPRVIGVAAPSAGDEATICGAELALAYADSSSEQVLLLEFDTQRPRLAKTLGIPVEYCFAMQMYDKYDGSPEHWRALSVFRSNLHVLAISPDLMAGERLFPPVFQQALTDLALGPYGRIIIVCPKILDSADIGLVEGHVDGLLLTGPAGRTRGADLRRAAKQVAPTEVLGVVLLEPN